MINCTILIRKGTRKKLKGLGRKAQTYDDLINELIERRQNSLNRRRRFLERPFVIEDANTLQRENEKRKTLVGQRFEPLAQQAPGDQ